MRKRQRMESEPLATHQPSHRAKGEGRGRSWVIALALGVVALVSCVVITAQSPGPAALANNMQDAEVSIVDPPRPAPKPRFSRTMYADSSLADSTRLLDECKGPVAVWLGEKNPTLVAEHDYCGGSGWMSKLKVGETVKLDGMGVDAGIFVVTSLKYETRNEVTVGDLPEADVVLQTCVTETKLVLVAMERFVA
ncbi:MAG: hypothetical protein ABIN55_14565 [Aeromicrobium sp.]